MTELTPQERLQSLANRKSNAATVKTIESVGSNVNKALSGVAIYQGASAAVSTATAAGGSAGASLVCFVAPLASGFLGAIAGGMLASKLGMDDKLLDFLGAERQASPGPEPAVLGHRIAHSFGFFGALGGMVGGLLAGIAVGALAAVAVAATIGSGGLLGPVIIAAAAGGGGAFVGSMIAGAGAKAADVTGALNSGSPDVFFEKRPVARVTDTAICSKHSAPPQIAEGSQTIFVNGLPLARIGHKTTCAAVIQDGCKTITADDTTGQYGKIDAEYSVFEQVILSSAETALSLSAIKFRSSKTGKKVFGEPIDPTNGDYYSQQTDFEYQGIITLSLIRTYPGKDKVEGLLGTKWICNWSQRLIFSDNETTVLLEDAEGQHLQFNINGPEYNAKNLKTPYYHLSGTRNLAIVFDTRTQQRLTFSKIKQNSQIANLTAIEDRNDNYIQFIYSDNHLEKIIHSDGMVFKVKTNSQGYISVIEMEDEHRPLVEYQYDESGAITNVYSRFYGEFHYEYQQPQGWLNHWHDSGVTQVDLIYDAFGRVIFTKTPDGLYNDEFRFYPSERKTEYIDATGNMTTLWYNESELIVKEEDPMGRVTEYEWDSLERKKSTTDPLNRITRFHYDVYGNLTEEVDWAGRTKKYEYDSYGLITQIEYPDERKLICEYDDSGNLIHQLTPEELFYSYEYDDFGRVTVETRPDGSEICWEYNDQNYSYTEINERGYAIEYEQDIWGRIINAEDEEGKKTKYYYDYSSVNLYENVSKKINPDGGESFYRYDREGLLETVINEENHNTNYKYGAFDLLRKIINSKQTVSFEYDNTTRLEHVRNQKEHKWKYSYDKSGLLKGETDWSGRYTEYIYDKAKRLQTKILPDNTRLNYCWDDNDRLKSISTNKSQIVYEYDESDRLTRASTYKNIYDKKIELESDIHYIYNKFGCLVKEIQNEIIIEYSYDESGRIKSRISPSGKAELKYNSLGLLSELCTNDHKLIFKYNTRGQEKQRYLENGLFNVSYGYDKCGRIKLQQIDILNTDLDYKAENPEQIIRQYEWHKNDLLKSINDSEYGHVHYEYNGSEQIIKVDRQSIKGCHPLVETYEYDSLNNLSKSNGKIHKYQYGEIQQIDQIEYKYDKRGRVIAKTIHSHHYPAKEWTFQWDDFDRLTHLKTPQGNNWHYKYDAFGRRYKKTFLSDRKAIYNILYLWYENKIVEEWKIQSNTKLYDRWHFEPNTFIPIAKETISQEIADEGKIYPVISDHLGTPKKVFNSDGECLWSTEHNLWGEAYAYKKNEQADYIISDFDCNLRFQNQWEDEESNLFYNLNRYYDPEA